MSPSLLNFLVFLLSSITSTIASDRHIIKITATIPRPTAFTWDPTAQHFVVGCASHHILYSISDAGVAETIVSDTLISSVSSISLDKRRRRLLVVFSDPNTLTAYDLRSPRPHNRIFSSSLPSSPGAVAVDPVTGFVFVTGLESGDIWRVDLHGNVSNFSKLPIYGGLIGLAHVRKGYLLVLQEPIGRIFKVDEETGAAKQVIVMNGNPAPEAQGIAVLADGTAVAAGWRVVRKVQSKDGWAEAAVIGEVKLYEEWKMFKGVTVRERKRAYVLVTPEEYDVGGYNMESRILEVELEEEEDLLWLMVLVGFGLAYFLYWRFQMRQLVSNMNRKRE